MSERLELKHLRTIPLNQYSQISLVKRYGNSVFATVGNSIAQINFVNSYVDQSSVSHQNISARFLKLKSREGVYVGDSATIRLLDYDSMKCTTHLRPFSQTSTFTGQFFANSSILCFSKYHKDHKKYSISVCKPGQESRVLKLTDIAPQSLILCGTSSVYYIEDRVLKHIDLQSLCQGKVRQCDNLLTDDSNYYEVAEGKVRAYSLGDKKQLYQFKSESGPQQIQEFGNNLLVLNRLGLQQLDVRMIQKPMRALKGTGLVDFLLEPNLQTLFVNDGNLSLYSVQQLHK